ncbi:hypothetical protein EJB05_31819, partial [Eragrostis curvula]
MSDGETQEEEEEQEPVLLKGAIKANAFRCDACDETLGPPVFQCSMGHFICCSSCRDELQKCQICAGCSSLERSYVMERAVESVRVDCRYTDHGCQERTAWNERETHENACPHARCSCPHSGCGFAGRSTELLHHLTAHHKCPCTEFRCWSQFDLRVEPGIHVLLDKDDGQVLLVSTQEQPPGYAISIVIVPPCIKKTGIGCSASFSHRNLYGSGTLDFLPFLSWSGVWPVMGYICSVPKFPHVREDTGVELKIKIVCADATDEEDDGSYLESEEDDEDSP